MSEKQGNPFPYEFKDFTPDEDRDALDYLNDPYKDLTRIGPKKFVYTNAYKSDAATVYNLPLRSDDTFIVTYPRSGTTLTQDLIWLIKNNLDYEKAKSIYQRERFPFLEISTLFPPDTPFLTEEKKRLLNKFLMPLSVKDIMEMPSPRFIKSHLPLSLLPPSLLDITKVVYVARDPRDVAVSCFHHYKSIMVIKEDTEFKQFWNLFVKDKILWCPYFEHILEAWDKRDHPNMLFLFYEDLSKDLPDCIRRVATFLGKSLSEEQVNGVYDYLKFDNFKKNKSVNLQDMQEKGLLKQIGGFIRKGKAGGWPEYFDEEMTRQAEQWMEKHLRGTDLRYPNV